MEHDQHHAHRRHGQRPPRLDGGRPSPEEDAAPPPLPPPPQAVEPSEKKKSVRLSPVARVAYVDHLSDMPDDVAGALYGTPQDARRVEAGVVRSIRAYRSGRLTLDGSGPGVEDTIRGLEHVVSASELRRKKDVVARSVEAVLEAQSLSRRGGGGGEGSSPGPGDEEALARAYAAAGAAEARAAAAANGRRDEAYVRLHVAHLPRPLPRPILKKENSVSRGVLARLGGATTTGGGEGDPPSVASPPSPPPAAVAGRPSRPSQQLQTHQDSASEGGGEDLVAILDRAIVINATTEVSPQEQHRQAQAGSAASENSTLWASLSREAVAFPSVVAGGQPPPPPPPPSSSPGGGGGGSPPKLARDVLERISLTLRAEKDAALPVAVPLPPLTALPRSSSDALVDMLARTSTG